MTFERARRILLTLSLLAIPTALAATPTASRQRSAPARIRFKRGASSATVGGQLTSRRLEKVYLIDARAGQEMFLRVTAQSSDGLDFANAALIDPAGRPVGSTQAEGIRVRLKQTGQYRIEVTPPGSFYNEKLKGHKSLRFSLFVSIT